MSLPLPLGPLVPAVMALLVLVVVYFYLSERVWGCGEGLLMVVVLGLVLGVVIGVARFGTRRSVRVLS